MSGVTRLTLLGTGSSGGVPRANGDWGDCDPANPRNRRRRCSALLERAKSVEDLDAGEDVTRIVIDTSPDFREQMISAGVRRLDGVLLTHEHADQTHGIDDVRAFALLQRKRIPVWMDARTAEIMLSRFSYTFVAPENSIYPPILDARSELTPLEAITIDGPGGQLIITPFNQEHGPINSLGFLCDGLAYSADINALPANSAALLQDVDCWAVDALREEAHPTHFSVSEALNAVEAVGAVQAVLTNLHITLDYQALSSRLPKGVHVAYDGLRITKCADAVAVV
ncbi:MBL fold metallo-hydrolase [Maricaulis sp. MIT060901]|uniref:MBL fold metallo-hydrolase n=1 Tax=Maricaulis sp. MIT060901 TaxID=3096993 RepID=UPI0039995DEC